MSLLSLSTNQRFFQFLTLSPCLYSHPVRVTSSGIGEGVDWFDTENDASPTAALGALVGEWGDSPTPEEEDELPVEDDVSGLNAIVLRVPDL